MTVANIFRFGRVINFCQTEIIAGIKYHILIFIRKTDGNAEVDRLADV